jgi:hypothetical protein
MKIDKVKKQLKKINSLFDNIEEDGQVSSIERDLLKSYIRDLYEKVALDDYSKPEKAVIEKKVKSEPKRNKTITKSIFEEDIEPIVHMDSIEQVVERELTTVANGRTAIEIDAVIDMDKENEEVAVITEGVTEEYKEKIEMLFQEDASGDLSSRLGKLPIKDLSQALGLNDKILTINELFKGDGGQYQNTIQALNGLSTFADARVYLEKNVIFPNNWLEDGKLKKAARFIRVIQRRYM